MRTAPSSAASSAPLKVPLKRELSGQIQTQKEGPDNTDQSVSDHVEAEDD
jgi:hypothetical protein